MRRTALTALAALALAGCTSVETEQQYTGPRLARPDVIVVYDFAATPDEVQLGRGLIADVDQALQSTPRTAQEQTAGHMVADAFAGHVAFSAAAAVATDVASETLSATVEDDADRAAKHLAVFFTEQGWIMSN